MLKPLVLDISSYNDVQDFAKVYAEGVRGVILKATQGTRYTDKTFTWKRTNARAAGLKVGAYHFGTAAPVDDQVAHFLEVVGDDADLAYALDYEKNDPNPGDSMSLAQARRFLQLVFEKTGQRPKLYSGNWIKQSLPKGGDAFFNSHQLWLAHYVENPVCPPGWTKPWLHQYSDRGQIKGIVGNVDCNAYHGADLAAEWIDRPAPQSNGMVAAAPSFPPAADGNAAEANSVVTLASATSSAVAINELADQGSRIALTLKKCKAWLWRAKATVVTGGGGVATLMATNSPPDPNTEPAGDVIRMAISNHPILVLVGLAVLLAALVGLYVVVKRIEKWLLTAYRDGRYQPRQQD